MRFKQNIEDLLKIKLEHDEANKKEQLKQLAKNYNLKVLMVNQKKNNISYEKFSKIYLRSKDIKQNLLIVGT